MNKMGKIWQKFDKKSQFWIFFQYNHVLKPSQWIETSRFHMEMFWGFQKGIKHVSISNGCGVGSYNQGGLIFIFKTFWCVFYSRASYNSGNTVSHILGWCCLQSWWKYFEHLSIVWRWTHVYWIEWIGH